MKPLIVANWKMNPLRRKDALQLFGFVKKFVAKTKNVDVVVCPPFVYLPLLKGLPLGAQDVFWEEKGAFTGEISAAQVKDLGVEYVIIGHSERRRYFGETNEGINKKMKAALKAGLKVIFCVGENEGEDMAQVLEQQITEGLAGVSNVNGQMSNVVIAYEPIWAIGTGNNCSTSQAQSAMLLIRKIISQLYSRGLADKARILYGGSVNGSNAAGYLKEAGMAGLLVGGASLDAKEFKEILISASFPT